MLDRRLGRLAGIIILCNVSWSLFASALPVEYIINVLHKVKEIPYETYLNGTKFGARLKPQIP